jgi:hypothetical protein
MEPAELKSRNDLKAWLKDKPIDWGQVIAIRSALRGLPYAIADVQKGWMQQFAMLIIRAAIVTWSAKYFADGEMDKAVNEAGNAMHSSSLSAAMMASSKRRNDGVIKKPSVRCLFRDKGCKSRN